MAEVMRWDAHDRHVQSGLLLCVLWVLPPRTLCLLRAPGLRLGIFCPHAELSHVRVCPAPLHPHPKQPSTDNSRKTGGNYLHLLLASLAAERHVLAASVLAGLTEP